MAQKSEIIAYLKNLQDSICLALEATDGKGKFKEDLWQHASGGGGRTRAIVNGRILEKGGVNFSAVEGTVTEALQKQLGITDQATFTATGVSIVLHPVSPMVPIIHMNVRYFELSTGVYWFGGGIDLTPHYVDNEQAKWFHEQLKAVCDKHDLDYYLKFKNWADDYFFISHRQETRGIGGIFYDHLKENEKYSKTDIFEFMKSVGDAFAGIYTQLMILNADIPFTQKEKDWQMIRRGRYVEFNLVWDRGTKFGLETQGRTESILMSMPPVANWAYDHKVEPNSKEEKTLSLLKKGIAWV